MFADATEEWIADTNWAIEQDRLRELGDDAAAEQEERDYHVAVARSLGLPVASEPYQGVSQPCGHFLVLEN